MSETRRIRSGEGGNVYGRDYLPVVFVIQKTKAYVSIKAIIMNEIRLGCDCIEWFFK